MRNCKDIGQAAVNADADKFVVAFLAGFEPASGAFLVLEGLRHVAVRDALCKYARETGAEVRFIHIETDEEQRAVRLRVRGESEAAIAARNDHVSEADVRDRLRDEADPNVHRGEDTSAMINEITTRLLTPAGFSL